MTIARITRTDTAYTIHLKGHAMHQGPNGDIVCASISTLVNVLCRALAKLPAEDHMIRIDQGEDIEVKMFCKVDAQVQTTVDIVTDVLCDLAEQYPHNLQVYKSALVENN